MAAVRRPTVPAPRTRAEVPEVTAARVTAWMATERGSRRAAAAKETVSGSLGGVSEGSVGKGKVGNSLIAPPRRVINPLL